VSMDSNVVEQSNVVCNIQHELWATVHVKVNHVSE
jgi:hypothetical protein